MTKLQVALVGGLGLTACVVPASQFRAQELETKKCYEALENENASKKELQVAVQDLQTAMDNLTAEQARLSSEKGQLEESVSALEQTVNLYQVQLGRRGLQRCRLRQRGLQTLFSGPSSSPSLLPRRSG